MRILSALECPGINIQHCRYPTLMKVNTPAHIGRQVSACKPGIQSSTP
jgi:hypothetical protein